MGQQIGQIPTHNTAPGGTNKIESENPTGPTSEYSTIAEMLAANLDLTKTTTQRDALSPTTNMHIYNSTTGQPEWYDGTVWRSFAGDISPSASSQLGGFTAANLAEVESLTKATRMTFRPPDYNNDVASAWTVGRYKASPIVGSLSFALGVNALGAGAEVLAFAWAREGVAIIRKVTASFCGAAVSGTRAGACNASMFLTRANVSVGTSLYISPPDQVNVNGHGNPGKVNNQPPSQAFVSYSVTPATGTQIGGHTLDTQPIGIAESGITGVAGQTCLNDAVLYDHQVAEQPLILGLFCGFVVTLTCPASATSQTIGWNINVEWDELTPSSPGDY